MMSIFAVKRLDVKRDPGILGERLEKFAEKLRIHRADFLGRKARRAR